MLREWFVCECEYRVMLGFYVVFGVVGGFVCDYLTSVINNLTEVNYRTFLLINKNI